VSNLIVMLTMPAIGAFADLRAAKKRLLMLFTAGCVLSTGLLAGVGLRDQQIIDVDAELGRVAGIERVFRVDEGAGAAAALHGDPDPATDGAADTQGLHWLRARLAALRGEAAGPWIARASAGIDTSAAHGLAWKRRLIEAICLPGPYEPMRELTAHLAEGGMRSQQRSAEWVAARAALPIDRSLAIEHARRALEMVADLDPWVDSLPSLCWHCYEVLAAAGEPVAAREALQRGRRWLLDRSQSEFDTAAERDAFVQGHPLHHRLLALAARLA
jgi:hypothetical protein